MVSGNFASDATLVVQTPTWLPGDYNFMQFARDIFDLKATDIATGTVLEVRRDGWAGFRVHNPGGDVELCYRAYAFEPAFGEACGILNRNYAVLLGTRYLFCKDHLGACRVRYQLPVAWEGRLHHASCATLVDATTFDYPSYEILLDTPVVMGDFKLLERRVGGIAIYACFVDHAPGYDARAKEFADDDTFKIAIRVCAHERFHAWSVRRLRPAPLLDLEHRLDTECFTDGLWVAEGFTR